MPEAALSVVFDHRQKRLWYKPVSTLVSGDDWNPKAALQENTWIDPVNGVLMLAPAPTLPGWFTSGMGIYARYTLSNFTGYTAGKWQDSDNGFAGNTWLQSFYSDGDTRQTLKASVSWPKNQPFYLSWIAFSGPSDDFVALEFGVSNTGDGTAGVSFRATMKGLVEVWKDGELLDTGNIGPGKENQPVELLVIPYRRTDVLIYCLSNGKGFSYTFEDVDPEDDDPTITLAEKFWFAIGSGNRTVQIAPVLFPSSGYRPGLAGSFKWAPGTGETPGVLAAYYDDPYNGSAVSAEATLRSSDDSGDFTPDGSTRDCLVRVTLGGDGAGTPFVYGARAEYSAIAANTSDEEQDVTSYTLEAELCVPDNPADVELRVRLKKPTEIELNGASRIRTLSNRPVLARLGDLTLLDGFANSPEWSDEPSDEVSAIEFKIRDRMKALEETIFDDPIPIGDKTVTEALAYIAEYCGLDSTMYDIEETDTPMGRYAEDVIIEVGDSALEWFQRIVEDKAGTWFWGIKPYSGGPKLFALSPDTLGTTPARTLYRTSAEAQAALVLDGYSAAEARALCHRHVYRASKGHTLPAESNDITVTGLDGRTGRPVVGVNRDTDASNPATSKGSRPTNWHGSPLTYGLQSPDISPASLSFAVETLSDRLMNVRELRPFETLDLLVDEDGIPLWRGDVVELIDVDGVSGSYTYRLLSLHGTFDLEPDGVRDHLVRRFSYVGELISEDA